MRTGEGSFVCAAAVICYTLTMYVVSKGNKREWYISIFILMYLPRYIPRHAIPCTPYTRTSQRVPTRSYVHTYFTVDCTYSIFSYKYCAWNELVPACNSRSSWNLPWQLEHIWPRCTDSKRFGRGQRRIGVQIRGLHSHPPGRNRWFLGGVRCANVNAQTHRGSMN